MELVTWHMEDIFVMHTQGHLRFYLGSDTLFGVMILLSGIHMGGKIIQHLDDYYIPDLDTQLSTSIIITLTPML
jgi:hypothetical protein